MRALVKLDRGKPVILRRMQDWWIVRKRTIWRRGPARGDFSFIATVRDLPTRSSTTTPDSSSRLTSRITVVWSTSIARARSESVRGRGERKNSSIRSSRWVSVRKIGRTFCTLRSISCKMRRTVSLCSLGLCQIPGERDEIGEIAVTQARRPAVVSCDRPPIPASRTRLNLPGSSQTTR